MSNNYAIDNKKYNLPSTMPNSIQNEWLSKLELPIDEFKLWINDIKDTTEMLLSPSFIKENFTDGEKFDYWISKLSDNYWLEYKGTKLLICGLGVSPDYAFPIISPTSPIPNPKDQGIVFISSQLFNNLGPNPTDIVSYYNFNTSFDRQS